MIHLKHKAVDQARLALLYRSFGQGCLTDYLDFRAVFLEEDVTLQKQRLQQILEDNEPFAVSHLKIGGNELKELGICGRQTGVVLEKLCDLVLENPHLNNTETLREYAKGFVEQK